MRLAAILSISLLSVGIPAYAQDEGRSRLDTIRVDSDRKPEPEIKRQPDLDTFQLASAHRERAESMREKTDGLWRSWVVSICEGCGPELGPYSKRRWQLSQKASPAKAQPMSVAAQRTDPKVAEPKAVAARPSERRNVASIYEDLSNARIDEIRRMPAP